MLLKVKYNENGHIGLRSDCIYEAEVMSDQFLRRRDLFTYYTYKLQDGKLLYIYAESCADCERRLILLSGTEKR